MIKNYTIEVSTTNSKKETSENPSADANTQEPAAPGRGKLAKVGQLAEKGVAKAVEFFKGRDEDKASGNNTTNSTIQTTKIYKYTCVTCQEIFGKSLTN